MVKDIKEDYTTNINFQAKQNVTSEVQKMEASMERFAKSMESVGSTLEKFSGMMGILMLSQTQQRSSLQKTETSLERVSKSMSTLGSTLDGILGIVGLTIIHHFSQFANEVTEIDNRLHLLNSTVVDTKLSFYDLIDASNQSRTSIQNFSELFTRIGMSSGHFFKNAPGGLLLFVETLNKQFQMMHLLPSQLLSVQTSILDAMELGYFDWRHMKAGLAHDNPLFRGYLNYVRDKTGQGDAFDVQKASRSRSLTAESFIEYVLQESTKINENFERMTVTIGQFGNIMKNELLSSFKDFFDFLTASVNYLYKGYLYLKKYHPNMMLFLQALTETTGVIAGMILLLNTGVFLFRSLNVLATTFNLLTGGFGWTGLALLGAGLFTLFAGHKLSQHHQLNKNELPTTNVVDILRSIQQDTHSISKNVGVTREKITDLVARTESMLIHSNIQRNWNLDGTNTETIDMLNRYLRDSMDSSGV